MQAPKLHAGEIDISTGLAARLIAEQFPHWAGLPIRPVSSAGTECVLYRLGDDLVIRLPRRPGERLDAILTQGVLARALSMALGHLDYYSDTNPVMAGNARYTICEVLADYRGISD
jgi:hypothetical protein